MIGRRIISVLLLLISTSLVFADYSIDPNVVQFNQETQELLVSVQDTIIFHDLYAYIDGSWNAYRMQPKVGASGVWLLDNADVSITLNADKFPEGESSVFIAVYSCTWSGLWDCHSNNWQIKVVSVEKPIEAQEDIPLGYACEVDADCAVKDVHNCCGYYPRCVNVDYEPDIQAVIDACGDSGMSVCGWPEIDECRCVANKCESFQQGGIV